MTSRRKIWLSPPHLGELEYQYATQAFQSNWIAPLGPHVDAFEEELAAYLGVPKVVALSSGTAAIHLALILLGVTRDDSVLVSSFTFAATANPIRYQGARPFFIGAESETLGMSPRFLDEALEQLTKKGTKPKAVIGVDLFGIPEKNEELEAICARYEIPFIEDAAEALGSSVGTRKCGGYGSFGTLSFNGNKIITTGGGGALVTHDETLARKAKYLATQARDPAPHYEHSMIGYNYRLSNLSAAVGRGQLRVLEEWKDRRRANRRFYEAALKDIPGVSVFAEPKDVHWNSWLTLLQIDPNKARGKSYLDALKALGEVEIEARPVWKPLHLQPVFKDCEYFGDEFEVSFFDKGLCLPSGSAMSERDLTLVSETLRSLFNA